MAVIPGPIADCLAGGISPEVAVARMLLAGYAASGIADALGECGVGLDDARRAAMTRLVEGRSDALDRLAAEVRDTSAEHDASGGPERIAAFFDRAVAHSAEASVALYSLGDPAILEAATNELVDWLVAHRLLPDDADVLDLGCGIGRVAGAMAPRCRSVLGLDVSGGMVAEARRRTLGLPGLRFEQTDGTGLDAMEARAFDLVLIVDAMPYIVQAGLVDAHFAGAARVLRDGGALVVLNFSYRGDRAADVTEATMLAGRLGFTLEQAGVSPFRVWDGVAFVFRR